MLLPDIRWWNELALETLETELNRRITTIDDVNKQLADIGTLPGWGGDAANAAHRRFADTANQLTDEAAALGAVRTLTTQTREAVHHLKTTLATIDRTAADNGLEIWDSGHVSIADTPNAPDAATVEPPRLELIESTRAIMRQADDIVADAATVLNKAADDQISDEGAPDVTTASTTGDTQGGLTALPPPENGTPQQNNAYWAALSPQQQRAIIDRTPEWVGNRDGIPTTARHEANVNRIDDERARLTQERDRLKEHMTGGPGERGSKEERELQQTEAKLKDLDAIENVLQENPLDPNSPNTGARLMLLDMQSGDNGMAAVSVGDPDNAEHVSVTTPGVGTTVQSMPGMVDEATRLQQEAEKQLGGNDETRGQNVASIAWIGYEPPPTVTGAVNTGPAEDGAPKLAGFFSGLDAASNQPEPHITALGHSYGSYTTALALQDSGPGQPVDNAVFYGSPGINADDESDLGLPQGSGYVMRAHDDPIVYGDGTGLLGPDPVTTNLEQLSVKETTTGDGIHREDSNGHSEYPRLGANGELRTAGFNMAAVVAGRTDLLVR